MFGNKESLAAKKAVKDFRKNGCTYILEIGAGQGRDTLYFGRNNLTVNALDYSNKALLGIREKANKEGLLNHIETAQHDIRKPLPYENDTFDAVYSHMLYCMALKTSELEFLSSEIRRILKPGGINIYTVRNTEDSHYRKGVPRGEEMFQVGGYIVHFFSKEKIEMLSKGYDLLEISDFEEGALPKKLYYVVLKKT